MKNIGVGIIGAGLIGEKRAAAIRDSKIGRLACVADSDYERAQKLAGSFAAEAYDDWKKMVRRNDIDVVIIAVPNKFATPITLEALKQGKHVLCEKPFGLNAREAKKMLDAGKTAKKMIKVGFNHRFHPGILKAKEAVDSGVIGKVLFIRARYGHGGRMGMEKEWRSDPNIAGGGELLDQGVHIIDLCRWFAGEFTDIFGEVSAKFWKTKVEDNAFAIMRNKTTTASFHVSTTNWGNIFSFEIFGDKGAVTIEGLGRRYGQEVVKVGIRELPFNTLKIKEFSYPADIDDSWTLEWKNFMSAIAGKAKIIGGASDGYEVNKIVDAIYSSSHKKRVVKLRN